MSRISSSHPSSTAWLLTCFFFRLLHLRIAPLFSLVSQAKNFGVIPDYFFYIPPSSSPPSQDFAILHTPISLFSILTFFITPNIFWYLIFFYHSVIVTYITIILVIRLFNFHNFFNKVYFYKVIPIVGLPLEIFTFSKNFYLLALNSLLDSAL